jgi:ABC-type transport system involved in cytochrome c biogenesis permease subunit
MSRFFEKTMGIIAWLQIVASPTLFALIISAIIYFQNPTQTNLIIGIAIIVLGLIVGILYANKIWKTKGTMWFVSQISATPELDNLDRKKDDEKGSR